MTKISLGRYAFGLAAIGFGVVSLVWHDFCAPWQQIQALGNVPHRELLVYIAAAVEILGGAAIQWRKTARAGALTLGIIFLVFTLLWIPRVVAEPLVYDRYGNVFEQLSLVAGALIVYGAFSGGAASTSGARIARLGYVLFGICVVSFTLQQLFYLSATASFVPKWIPGGQMFWSVATTIFFALAALALLSGFFALLASRLVVVMILGFQFLVWLPAVFAGPHQLINWGGNADNLAIAGAAWIVADFLGQGVGAQESALARAA
jgi:uncharacterized membrane protein YphA (DoxX/SURF4 family)